jgi:elongation factor Ts
MGTTIDTKLIQQLREISGAGIVECKKMLEAHDGNIDKALQALREKGATQALKKSVRSAKNGLIASYIHHGDKIGVLLEINCETDFVARTEEFKNLVKEVGMQIAATNPQYVSREYINKEIIDKEKEIYRKLAVQEGKPEKMLDKIAEGRLEKFFEQTCLVDQPYIRDAQGKQRIKDLINAVIAKTGENVVIKRFTRYVLGEE